MDPRESPNSFGISDFLSPEADRDSSFTLKDFQCLIRCGAGWIRQRMDRRIVQPSADAFRTEVLDTLVDQFAAAKVRVLAVLTGSAIDAMSPPSFAGFAATLVAHFKERIRHWEIWHEPDDPAFWPASDGMASYTALLQETAAAIRAEDPSAIVHLGGLSRRLPISLKEIYQRGAAGAFDVVNMHPFMSPLMPDSVGGFRYFYEMVRRAMTAAGDVSKPIWFSQVGAPGLQDPRSVPDWWLGKNPTEVVQAQWVRTVLEEPKRWPGVEKIFWTGLRDHPDRSGHGHDYCGLVRADYVPKLAFDAFREIATTEVK
jgi:polysaccharide biosynthesis protein PslG